jgi:hypothetical protein
MDAKILEVDGDRNPTDIYTAITKGDWAAVLAECFTNPDQARTWVVKYAPAVEEGEGREEKKILTRFLPLHAAMFRNAPLQTAAAILMAFPEAVKEPDHRGMLPLHYACASGASEQCISMLLMMYNQGAKTADPMENSLPIHQLCQWGAISEEALHLLLIAYPESVDAKDSHGMTPLDIITENREGEDAMELTKVLKRCTLAISMNLDEKDGDNKANARIDELEQILINEKNAHDSKTELLNTEIGMLQEQVTYLRNNNSATEKQVMELQTAMQGLLGKQMDIDKRYSEATMHVTKLRTEISELDKQKRNLEELQKQGIASEKKQKQEISRLNSMLESYNEHNVALKKTVKSLNADMESKEKEIREMTKKMEFYAENFEVFYKELAVQVEQMKASAAERELFLEELLKKEKERNDAELAEHEQLLKNVRIGPQEDNAPIDKKNIVSFISLQKNASHEAMFISPMKQLINSSNSELFTTKASNEVIFSSPMRPIMNPSNSELFDHVI